VRLRAKTNRSCGPFAFTVPRRMGSMNFGVSYETWRGRRKVKPSAACSLRFTLATKKRIPCLM
jgi:hypothetical protein